MANCALSQAVYCHGSSGVEFRIVTGESELYTAFRLVHDAYVRIGLMLPNDYQMRVTPYHLIPTTEVVSALVNRQMACTASIVRDGAEGLPMDSVYGSNVNVLRDQGLRLAEVSCLADRRSESRLSFSLVSELMSLIAQICKQRGVDKILIAVHPRHGRFYQRYLGFERLAHEAAYPSVRNRPAVALSLDLNHLATTCPEGYQKLFGTPFPERVLREKPVAEDVLDRLRLIYEASAESTADCNTLAV